MIKNMDKLIRVAALIRLIVSSFVVLVIQLPHVEIINQNAVYVIVGIGLFCSLIYELLLRNKEDFPYLLHVMCGLDIGLIGFLVNFTGGIQSSFYLLYLMPLIFSSLTFKTQPCIFFGILVSTAYLFNMLFDIENIDISTYQYLFATRLPLFWAIVILGIFLSRQTKKLTEDSLEKGKIVEKLRDEISKMSVFYGTTSKLFSSLIDLENILRFVVERFPIITNMERCTIMFVDDHSGDLLGRTSNKIPVGELKWFMIRKEEPLYDWIVKDHKSVMITDPDPNKFRGPAEDFAERYKIKTMITLPLIGKEKCLGVIHIDNIDDDSPVRITEEELNELQKLINLVAVAIERVKEHELASEQRELIKRDQEILNEKMMQLSTLFDFSSELAISHKLDDVLAAIEKKMLINFVGAKSYRLVLLDPDRGNELKTLRAKGCDETIEGIEEEILNEVIKSGEPFLDRDIHKEEITNIEGNGNGVLLCFPLKKHNVTIALLEIKELEKEFNINLTKYVILLIAANLMAISISNAQLYEKISYLSIIDGLTNLYNFTYFKDRINEEISRAQRHNQPLSILMIDIDHFKSINTIYGHQVGNRILVEIAEIIKKDARKIDIAVRYGGDEIALVLTNTDKEKALVVGKRICNLTSSYRFPIGSAALPVTVSIGIVTSPDDGVSEKELINKVEKIIQKAKSQGGNQVQM
ncbi:MAG: diguanylate cyclase [bacterium]|nr:diguanylate cyclase [bacterium]